MTMAVDILKRASDEQLREMMSELDQLGESCVTFILSKRSARHSKNQGDGK